MDQSNKFSVVDIWDMYVPLDFEQSLDFIKNTEYPIENSDDPWWFLKNFWCISSSDTPIEDAFRVANVFKNRFGLLVFSFESSYRYNTYQTIMDDLTCEDPPFWVGLLRYAFRKVGFLYAADIHSKYLYDICIKQWKENTFENGMHATHEEYTPLPENFAEELSQYLYHPDRVQQWLSRNPDKHIEDYLN